MEGPPCLRGEIIEGVEVAALWCGGTTQWANAVRGADVAPPPPDTIVQWVMAKVYGVIYSSRTPRSSKGVGRAVVRVPLPHSSETGVWDVLARVVTGATWRAHVEGYGIKGILLNKKEGCVSR